MGFRIRKRIRLGPLPIWANLSNSGISWSTKIWRWSANSRTRRQNVDLPGPFAWSGRLGRRRR